MADTEFPKTINEVITTLVEVFKHQKHADCVELLRSAHAWFDSIGYESWDGGTHIWALRLEVPAPLFASVEARLPDIEKEITTKLGHFNRQYPNNPLNQVTISPIAADAKVLGQRIQPSELEVRRLWPENRFRLFLSHVSMHRVAVSNLKNELAHRGVAAFVAHEDIEPSLEWRDEIELGLKSMHALAALVTPDFHASAWTDQEIGWAFGRGLLVLPVRLAADPYGFSGKVQAISATLDQPANLASSLVNALLLNAQTHGEMRRAIASAFSEAESYKMALTLRKLIVTIKDFTDEEKLAMQKACTENPNVKDAWNVPAAIYNAFGKPPEPQKVETTDDDVPF